jgi:hypothetical protein
MYVWIKGTFFQLIFALFCEVRWSEERFTRPLPPKKNLWSKSPCLGWRSANFLQGVFSPKNFFRTSAKMHVLVLRFMWYRPVSWPVELAHLGYMLHICVMYFSLNTCSCSWIKTDKNGLAYQIRVQPFPAVFGKFEVRQTTAEHDLFHKIRGTCKFKTDWFLQVNLFPWK